MVGSSERLELRQCLQYEYELVTVIQQVASSRAVANAGVFRGEDRDADTRLSRHVCVCIGFDMTPVVARQSRGRNNACHTTDSLLVSRETCRKAESGTTSDEAVEPSSIADSGISRELTKRLARVEDPQGACH